MMMSAYPFALIALLGTVAALPKQNVISIGGFRVVKHSKPKHDYLLRKSENLFYLLQEDRSWFEGGLSMSTSYPSSPQEPSPTMKPGKKSKGPTKQPMSKSPQTRPIPSPSPSSKPTIAPDQPTTDVPNLPTSPSPTIPELPTLLPFVTSPPSERTTFSPSNIIFLTKVPTTPPSKNEIPVMTVEPQAPTFGPDTIPSLVPSFSPSVSVLKSIVPTDETVAFFCTPDGGIAFARPPFDEVTVVDIAVAYEVDTKVPWQLLRKELESHILREAVNGALQCDEQIFECGCNPPVQMLTQETGEACQAIMNDTICTVLETEFQILLREDLDPEAAAYFGYVEIQTAMESGRCEEAIDDLERIGYLRPDEVIPLNVGGSTNAPARVEQGSVSVSPWTVGAVLAMSLGGVAALLVWLRNRRIRNERHMQLLEDLSIGSPQTTTVTPSVVNHSEF